MLERIKTLPTPIFVFTAYGSRAATQFVILLTLARFDGPVMAGLFATCLAISAPIFALCELGLRNFYQTTTLRVTLRRMLMTRLAGSLTAAVLALTISYTIRPDLLGLMLPVVALKLCDGLVDVVDSGQLTEGRYLLSARAAVSNALLTVAAFVVALSIGWSGATLVWLSALVSVAVLAGLLTHPVQTVNQGAPEGRMRDILGTGLRLGVAQFASSLTTYVPVLFLSLMVRNEASAGIYAAAQYWITLTNMVYLAVQQASWRVLRASLARGYEELRRRYRPVSRRFLLLAPACGLVVGFGTYLGNPLIYGEAFAIGPVTALVFAGTTAAMAYEYSQVTKVLSANRYALPAAAAWVGLVAALTYLAFLPSNRGDVTTAAGAVLLAVAARGSLLTVATFRKRRGL